MQTPIVDLPKFVVDSSLSPLERVFEPIVERINIAAAYQRFCLKTLDSNGLSAMERFGYEGMFDWACDEMDAAHHAAQRICELTGQTLRVRHDYGNRRWILEVTR
jgi:hypothetical protein